LARKSYFAAAKDLGAAQLCYLGFCKENVMYNRDTERQQYEDWHRYGRERGWMDRATDEVRSWFGDEEAERRRRMDQMERERYDRSERGDHGHRYEDSRPSWQDRNYSGVSPRGYDLEERGRFGMEGGARRDRANREHWSFGGTANDYDYDYGTEYGGGRFGRERYGREQRFGRDYGRFNRDEEMYGRDDYGWQRRGGLGRRFFEQSNIDRDRERDFESGMGYGSMYGSMSSRRELMEDERSYDRPRGFFGRDRGGMFANRDDERLYRGGERGGMFGGMHRGRGPRNFQRSDERLTDEIHQVLTFHPDIDASDIEVLVDKGIVTLRGKVEDRRSKRLAEDLCEDVYGVREVRNELRTEHGLFSRSEDKPIEQRGNNSLLNR
jgi:osmotically-inducible protein OsmY